MIDIRKFVTKIPAMRRLATATVILVLMGWGGTDLNATSAGSSQAAAVQAEAQEHVAWPHTNSDLLPDPAITFGQLSNGFRYILMENHRPEDRVSLHLYIRAGSLQETNSQQGLAHFLEHMLFNGSTHFPPGELVRYFQSIGMQFGNDANAHTGFDETVYDIILPAGDEQHLDEGLLVMRDYAMGALLLETEVKREAGVILSEMRSRDSSDYRTFEATLKFELPDLRVSRRLPIGSAEVIEKADREQLKAFYDAWYRPDNMILVMVGDFSKPLAKRLISEQFSGFTARAPLPQRPDIGTIDHKGLKVFFHHEAEAGGTTVSIETLRLETPVPDSLAQQRRRILSHMADRIVQNRLDARLKAPAAPFTSAAVGSGVYLNRIRYAEISADSSPANWRKALATMEQALRRAKLHGFTKGELERVKKETLAMLDNAVKEAATRNSTNLARSIIRQLAADQVIQSPQQEQANLAPLVKNATLGEIQQAFVANWPDDQRLILVTGNADLNIDPAKTPQQLIRDAFLASAAVTVTPPQVEALAKFPYLPEPTTEGVIASRESIPDLGITRVVLGNGIRLNVKRTDFKTNEVQANLIFGRGSSSEPEALPGLALLGETTVAESGLGAMDTHQLEQALAGKSTQVDFSITESHFGFSAHSVSDETALMIQLLYAHIADPGFRQDALELARERLRQEIHAFSRSIEGMMRIEGLKFLAGGDSRFGIPAFESIQAIGLDDIRNWIAPDLESAPMELSVVGDIDEDAVIELARRYLGALPDRRDALTPLRAERPHLPKGAHRRIEVDTQIPKALVVAAWQTEDFWNIGRTRRLSVLADIFSERLREVIREKLGASYSPYAFNRASRAYNGYGVFQAYVNVAPDQTDRVLDAVHAIAIDLSRNGINPDELARSIDPILTSIKEMRKTNDYWIDNVMTGSSRHPQQIEWARSFMDDYASVTVDDVNRLAADYLTDARSAAVIIEPKMKAAG